MQEGLGDELHRHLERQARDGHRPGGDRHQRARIADGLCRDRAATTTTARRALDVLRDWARMYGGNLLVVLPDCFGTTHSSPMRPIGSPTGRARGPIRIAARRCARADRLVARARPRPAGEADRAVGRDGHQFDRDAARALRGEVNLSVGWGTNLTNDFSVARLRGSMANCARFRWSARSSRRTVGRRSSCPTIPTKRWER